MIPTKIPQEIIDVANSIELFDSIEQAIIPFNLHINQIGEVSALVSNTLKGIIPREDLLKHLVEDVEVDNITADKLLKTLNVEVFQKLRELILTTHQASEGGNAEETLAGIEDTPETSYQSETVRVPINVLERVGGGQIHDLETIPGQTAHDVPRQKVSNPLQSLTTPLHNPINSEILQAKKPTQPSRYEGTDPYREPIA